MTDLKSTVSSWMMSSFIIAIGMGIVLIGGFFLALWIENSCAYHEPTSLEPDFWFRLFAKLESGHPVVNSNYWLSILMLGLFLGQTLLMVVKRLQQED